MYEIKGFVFKEVEGEIKCYPLSSGLFASGYEEVHEVMSEMNISNYMFILKEVRE